MVRSEDNRRNRYDKKDSLEIGDRAETHFRRLAVSRGCIGNCVDALIELIDFPLVKSLYNANRNVELCEIDVWHVCFSFLPTDGRKVVPSWLYAYF